MIRGNTATEYGDFLIASIQDPYKDVLRILDWEILAGLSDSTTVGKITLTAGSKIVNGAATNFSRYDHGDKIIVGNLVLEIDSVLDSNRLVLINNAPVSATNVQFYRWLDDYNNFTYEFRYSTDGNTYNEFHELNKQNDFGDLFSMNFNPRSPLYLDVKAEVNQLIPGNTLTLIAVTYTLERDNGIVESCPQLCLDCTDPFLYSGCANIRVDCEYENLFKPYNLNKAQQVHLQLANMVNDIFGHTVTYFKTEPDQRTKDVILMEYSLFNVVAQEDIKILVPDNEFPQESSLSYDIFGMDFEEFEIHIVRQEFEKAFGYKATPRNRDYMFIPIMNKMYSISSVAIGDRFNNSKPYWKIKLTKFTNETAVDQNEFAAATDDVITNIDEIFGAEIQETYAKDTKPMQYQTVSTAYRDGIRNFMHRDLNIIDYELKNRWTVVSKNYYNLTQIPKNETAIDYVLSSKLTNDENFAVTAWFQPQFPTGYAGEEFLFGDYDAMLGFRIVVSSQEIKISINGVVYSYMHGLTFTTDKWYGLILNGSNQFKQLSVYIYSLDPANNFGLPQTADNNLQIEFGEVKNVQQAFSWNSNTNYAIRGGKLFLTNIRLFNTPVEFEQHHNVLNQSMVRDSQLALIVDNAIPSIGFQKFKNAR